MANLRKRRDISAAPASKSDKEPAEVPSFGGAADLNEPTSDLEMYSKEVLSNLIKDNLPPTPNNFALYFDRLLEDKSQALKLQINSVLEFEDSSDDEKGLELEKSLKTGFVSIKKILQLTGNVYKNMNLMEKILAKRQSELSKNPDFQDAMHVVSNLQNDVTKLNTILQKQVAQIKSLYDSTATIVKSVDEETIYDNQFGIYNKRYLLNKLEQEKNLVEEFKHTSSILTLELSKDLEQSIDSEKAVMLMTRTVARLLMKTSRRSDVVAHYGDGIFSLILKHTDLENAKRASGRLCDLVSSSNFFLAEKEITLKVSIGIANINPSRTVEETIVCALDAMETAYDNPDIDYAIGGEEKAE